MVARALNCYRYRLDPCMNFRFLLPTTISPQIYQQNSDFDLTFLPRSLKLRQPPSPPNLVDNMSSIVVPASEKGKIPEDTQSQSGSSEASDVLDMKDDEGWDDVEPEEEEQNIISLLDDEVFNNVNQMLDHCKAKYNFDFLALRQKVT